VHFIATYEFELIFCSKTVTVNNVEWPAQKPAVPTKYMSIENKPEYIEDPFANAIQYYQGIKIY